MKQIGIGVIGLGFGRDVHVPAFRRDNRCQVLAIAGTSVEKAKATAASLKIPHAYGNYLELLENPQIDAVTIAVPPAQQGEIAEAAIAKGKHIFCEKPLGCESGKASQLATLASEKGLASAVDYEFCELETWEKAKAIIESRKLGAPAHIGVNWHLQTYTNKQKIVCWKTSTEERGGTLHNFVSHVFYYVEHFFGPIRSLNCSKGLGDNQLVELQLRFANGASGTVAVSTNSPELQIHEVEIHLEDGRIGLKNATKDYLGNFSLSIAGGETSMDPVTSAGGDGRILVVGKLASKFLDAISNKTRLIPGLAEGARVEYLLEQAELSERTKKWSAEF